MSDIKVDKITLKQLEAMMAVGLTQKQALASIAMNVPVTKKGK